FRNDSSFFEPLEAFSQNVGWDALRGICQLAVGGAATKQIPHNEQRPFIADPVEQIGDSTSRAPEPVSGLGRSLATLFWFCDLHIESKGAIFLVTCKIQVTRKEQIMMNTTLSSSVQSNPSPRTQTRSFAIFLLAVWFAVAFWLDARETFATPPGTPPL